jgi:Tfp pilus assembly protein PilF
MRFAAAAVLACVSTAAAAQRGDRPPALPAGADPNDWRAYYGHGVALLPNHAGRADAMFRWAARLDPGAAEPLVGRWVALHVRDPLRLLRTLDRDVEVLRMPGVATAEALRRKALGIDPFVNRGIEAMAYARAYGQWGQVPRTHAFDAYAHGDLDTAVRDYGRVLRRDPHDYQARLDLALVLATMGRLDGARVEIDSALADMRRRDASEVTAVYEGKDLPEYSAGVLWLRQGQPAKARERMARAVLEDASAWYPHRGIALTFMAEGRPADAVAEYRAALDLLPDDPLLLHEYAAALSASGQVEEAVMQLRKAVAIDPEWADAWLALGNAEAASGHPREAMEALTRYVARAPRREADAVSRARARIDELRASIAGPTP